MNSPSKTVVLCEFDSADSSWGHADIEDTDERGGAGFGGANSASPSVLYGGIAGVAGGAGGGGEPGVLATGYMGGAVGTCSLRPVFNNSNYYKPTTGRHTNGSNFLLGDGHVKWLQGSQVSTGSVLISGQYGETETTNEDATGNPACNAAGTQSSQPFAATFSPI
jgi:prepilin-type processing-associated H-X9-DG protein